MLVTVSISLKAKSMERWNTKHSFFFCDKQNIQPCAWIFFVSFLPLRSDAHGNAMPNLCKLTSCTPTDRRFRVAGRSQRAMIVINILFHTSLLSQTSIKTTHKMEFRLFLPLHPKFQQSSYLQLQKEIDTYFSLALHSDDAVWGMKSLHSLKHWDNGFESPRGMSAFILRCNGR